MRVSDIKSIALKLASPEAILKWSHGEVTKPETINYRTQKAEKDGLFCQKIFGPEKDYECYCGKYRKIRYKGIVCERCGVEVTTSSVRRERMGHIKLATPVSHIWFLKGIPSRIGLIIDIPAQKLEKVVYFIDYIITKIDEEAKKKALERIEKEYKQKAKNKKSKVALQELKRLRDKTRKEVLSLKPFAILSELEYHNLSLKYGEIFEAGTGAETLKKIFEKIDLKKEISKTKKQIEKTNPVNKKKILRRLRTLQGMLRNNVRPEWMFLTVLPVLPPDLRPVVQLDGGRYASSDLNDLYRRVINRNNRLKYLFEIKAPEVIIRNEKRMLQEAVDALIDNKMRKGTTTQATTGGKRLLKSLADMLQGKQGRFRQNLLGKRVDYSGRSVIVVGPDLKINQCGLPKRMALELFKPFVIKGILDQELAYNVRGASRLIEQETPEVWAILEEKVKGRLVLLNRAPTLHRLGIQAFQPVLIEGQAIQLHPLVCRAFNADFDGDQMPVHIPLSDEAQKEAREIMLSSLNLLLPSTGLPVITPDKDIVLGCYWLTKIKETAEKKERIFPSKVEALMTYEFGEIDLREKIKVRIQNSSKAIRRRKAQSSNFIKTSVGRIIFNETLPADFSFINEIVNSKRLSEIISEIIRNYDQKTIESVLDKIKDLGFEYSTRSAITWGMDDLIIPKEKNKLIEEGEKKTDIIDEHFQKGLLTKQEKTSQTIEVWHNIKSKIEELVPKTLPSDGPVFSIIDSGARGSWVQPVQMAGMKGLVSNPSGRIIELPIKNSFKEGFDVLEYFISTHGARKGTADTALRTSMAGYLTRRLVDVAHEVIVSEEDCGDKEGITLYRKDSDEIGQNFIFKITGRIALETIKNIVKKGEVIDWQKAERINEAGIKEIRVRSPLSCKSVRGVCQKCYGWDFGNNKMVKIGTAVGVIAAQAIGEPGTQLTMRTFHTGGVAGEADITYGLPRVEEIFEARSPKGEAIYALSKGKIKEIDKKKNIIKIQKIPKSSKPFIEYRIPSKFGIKVQVGQEVKKNQPLTTGNLDLRKLFQLAGKEEAQRYIVKAIQEIYAPQRITIHDKHIEIIVRQMFSRVKIQEQGDSLFSNGEIIEYSQLLEENARLEKEKKKPAKAKQILLGISKVSLTTDSFLSAASFQETSRVLIQAAIDGREDKFHGLKENVIIGRLIPVGTGFKK